MFISFHMHLSLILTPSIFSGIICHFKVVKDLFCVSQITFPPFALPYISCHQISFKTDNFSVQANVFFRDTIDIRLSLAIIESQQIYICKKTREREQRTLELIRKKE